jgi:hypothetical protein
VHLLISVTLKEARYLGAKFTKWFYVARLMKAGKLSASLDKMNDYATIQSPNQPVEQTA